MDRRLAKLIAIHFAPITDGEKLTSSPQKKSFIDLDLDELKRDRAASSERAAASCGRRLGRVAEVKIPPSVKQSRASLIGRMMLKQSMSHLRDAIQLHSAQASLSTMWKSRLRITSPHTACMGRADGTGDRQGSDCRRACRARKQVFRQHCRRPHQWPHRRGQRRCFDIEQAWLERCAVQRCARLPRLQVDCSKATVHDG